MKTKECRNCGMEFYCPSGREQVWCADKCRLEARRRARGVKPREYALRYSKVAFLKCGVCGRMYTVSANGGRTSGCRSCLDRWGAYRCDRIALGAYEVSCPICQIEYCQLPGAGGRLAAGCSDQCRTEIKRSDKRKYKYQRLSYTKTGEVFDPLEIFWRDKWKCRHCGCRAPKSLRGSCHQSAPELDHIIPLSKGGRHSRDNTQLLCRACNAAKSDGSLGDQLLMFG